MPEQQNQNVVEVAEKYYDSDDADQFYYNVWGGEDIHVGLYYGDKDPIIEASRRTVEKMASMLNGLDSSKKVLDIGAGYGGAARFLAKNYGCFVTALNISETQNERDRQMNKEQGLDDKIEVMHGDFENIGKPDGSYDFVWCQDSILHSGNRRRVLEEVRRVLKPGGEFVFTDPMQKKDTSKEVLQPILDRIHLDSLGSFDFYCRTAPEVGFEELEIIDMSEQLPRHYGRVRQELRDRYDELVGLSSKAYIDRMIEGLRHWVEGGNNGYLAWGILHFKAV